MLKKNVDRVLALLKPTDKVLDIGGWAQPFHRANWVVDINPYQSRGFFGHIGPEQAMFTEHTWVVQDLCSPKPLPFKDKEFDFVICSHTLEDIRDPMLLCAEMNRIGKRGYLEVPSRAIESTRGLESKMYTGYCHHYWMVEIDGSQVRFRFKTPLLNESWRYHLPPSFLKKLSDEERATSLFWEDRFDYEEVVHFDKSKVYADLERFVRGCRAYPDFYYTLSDLCGFSPRPLAKRFLSVLPPARWGVEKVLGRKLDLTNRAAQAHTAFWAKIPDAHSR